MDIEIKAVDILWLAGSIALLAWSARKVGRRFLRGDDAPYIQMALRGFGLAMFAFGLWAPTMAERRDLGQEASRADTLAPTFATAVERTRKQVCLYEVSPAVQAGEIFYRE